MELESKETAESSKDIEDSVKAIRDILRDVGSETSSALVPIITEAAVSNSESQASASSNEGESVGLPLLSLKANKSSISRRRRDHSEWLEKALEEGSTSKRRSRSSKRLSDPNFLFEDPVSVKDKNTTSPTTDSKITRPSTSKRTADTSIDLDFANMSNYEKFVKYKTQYREWTIKNKATSSKTGDSTGATQVTRQSPRAQKKLNESPVPTKALEEDAELSFKINPENIVTLDKDKFCWVCHKEVVENKDRPHVDEKRCKTCAKILHVRCDLNSLEGEGEREEWECKPCIEYRRLKENDLWAPYVEYLGYDKYTKQLRYIIEEMKKTYASAKEFLHPVNASLFPDYRQYIAHPVDFEQIDRRIKNREYRSVDILYEDFKWMLHNSVIYNGNPTAITKDLRVLLRYLRMDLYDLDSCACCYINAYTRPDAWFILPCPSPHLLVWAHLKGFPYWPAKVYDSHVEHKQGEILVKFFGDHARSWIPVENIYLYSLDPPSVCASQKKGKKTANLIPSLVEMEKHITLLKKQFGLFKYPEQDILIGTNTSERSLQLKYMLPSCTTTLPKKPCSIDISHLSPSCKADEKPDRVETSGSPTKMSPADGNASVPTILKGKELRPKRNLTSVDNDDNPADSYEPMVMDLNDANSKRSILSRLEERLQQCRSDSEDGSVKSFGKASVKSSGKDSIKSFGNDSVISDGKDSVKIFGKDSEKSFQSSVQAVDNFKNNSKAARSVRCQMFFRVLERKLRKTERGKKRGRKQFSVGNSRERKQHGENFQRKGISSSQIEKESEKSTTELDTVMEHDGTETGRHISKPPAKKPSCGDIDQFIETHLASTRPPEWDVNKIPPILSRDIDEDIEGVNKSDKALDNEKIIGKISENVSEKVEDFGLDDGKDTAGKKVLKTNEKKCDKNTDGSQDIDKNKTEIENSLEKNKDSSQATGEVTPAGNDLETIEDKSERYEDLNQDQIPSSGKEVERIDNESENEDLSQDNDTSLNLNESVFNKVLDEMIDNIFQENSAEKTDDSDKLLENAEYTGDKDINVNDSIDLCKTLNKKTSDTGKTNHSSDVKSQVKIVNEPLDSVDKITPDQSKHSNKTAFRNLDVVHRLVEGTENKVTSKSIKENIKLKESHQRDTQQNFRLKKQLFRHKKYSAQLFEVRKLTREMKKHARKHAERYSPEKESSEKESPVECLLGSNQSMPDISKYFQAKDVTISNPTVNLISLTVEELKELKRVVKRNKNNGLGLDVDGKSAADSEFVPIEDTMRISVESEDLNAMSWDSIKSEFTTVSKKQRKRKAFTSVIDEVATGNLPSDLNYSKLTGKVKRKYNYKAPRKTANRGRKKTFNSEDRLRRKCIETEEFLENQRSGWDLHIFELMKNLNEASLRKDPSSMLHDINCLKTTAEATVGREILNQIAIDSHYNTALNAAELVGYTEYVATYDPPELTPDDYDEVGQW